jgi:hypothetical protein
MKPAALALLVLGLPPAQMAVAQTVYRCGPEGRVYAHTPCADGRPVTVDDARSLSQQKAAHEVARGDADRAAKLADERRQREAAAKGQQAAGFMTSPAPAASAPAGKPQAKSKKPKKPATENPPLSPVMIVPAPAAPAKR